MKYLLLVRTRDPTRPRTAEVSRPYRGLNGVMRASQINEADGW
jgi:hypothetical protein